MPPPRHLAEAAGRAAVAPLAPAVPHLGALVPFLFVLGFRAEEGGVVGVLFVRFFFAFQVFVRREKFALLGRDERKGDQQDQE